MKHQGLGQQQYLQTLDLMIASARSAGQAIMAVYAEADFGVVAKDDESPVTRADLAAHHCIAAKLLAAYPEIPLLSEEGDVQPFQLRRQWRRYWLVDPLDGTREFIRRSDEFSVNIALVEDGVAVLGVVYAPAGNTLYAGLRVSDNRNTWRAWKIGSDGIDRDIHCNSQAIKSPDAPFTVVGSREHGLDKTSVLTSRLAAIWPRVEVRPMGSSLKMCLIAEGQADLYLRFGATGEWDTAAPQAVLEAAGGGLFDLKGVPLRYNQGEGLINPSFYGVGDPGLDWPALVADL